MQQAPHYENVIAEVRDFFRQSFSRAIASGMPPRSIAFDPGIGFGKTAMHNLSLLKNLAALRVEERPLVLGVSRKAFLGKVTGAEAMADRAAPTLALTAIGRANGANIFRVHDVKANVQALAITEAVLVRAIMNPRRARIHAQQLALGDRDRDFVAGDLLRLPLLARHARSEGADRSRADFSHAHCSFHNCCS